MAFRRLLLRGLSAVSQDGKHGYSILRLFLGMILYGIVPFDLIPDIIPLFGQMDDGVVALILLAFIIRILRKRKRDNREQIEQKPSD